MCVMGFLRCSQSATIWDWDQSGVLLNYPFYDFGEEIGTIIRFAYFR